MPIFVKGHRRGKSVVHAYTRTGQAIKTVENRVFKVVGATATAHRHKQLVRTLNRLNGRRETLTHMLNAKLSMGNALLSKRNVRASKRYFSSHMSKQFSIK